MPLPWLICMFPWQEKKRENTGSRGIFKCGQLHWCWMRIVCVIIPVFFFCLFFLNASSVYTTRSCQWKRKFFFSFPSSPKNVIHTNWIDCLSPSFCYFSTWQWNVLAEISSAWPAGWEVTEKFDCVVEFHQPRLAGLQKSFLNAVWSQTQHCFLFCFFAVRAENNNHSPNTTHLYFFQYCAKQSRVIIATLTTDQWQIPFAPYPSDLRWLIIG